MAIEGLVEVSIIVMNKLRGDAQQDVHGRVVLADAVQVGIRLLLDFCQGLASPHFMDYPCGLCAVPGTASIALPIKLQLLRIVPDAQRLNGEELAALSWGEAVLEEKGLDEAPAMAAPADRCTSDKVARDAN